MVTKNELKYYSSLLQKKSRDENKKFIVEGKKVVFEGLQSRCKSEIIFVLDQFKTENKSIISSILKKKIKLEVLNNPDFAKLTDTVTPQGIAAVFYKPEYEKNFIKKINSRLIVCLDNISDPGNLGTIFRNCDWFGIKDVLLINHCADIYNSKTIRSSMGSIFHLNIFEYIDFENDLINLKNAGYKIICADLEGKNIFNFPLSNKNIIVFSNEANGPSERVIRLSDEKITIPKKGNAESLNVASASAVMLSHFTKDL